MKPFTRSVIDLFDGKKRYLIPLYQRQYAWRRENLELLWEDIMRAVRQLVQDRTALTPHFMGAMVINQVKTYGKEVQAYEVIDGQQRLTTFQILLAALRDVAEKAESSYAPEVEKYLFNTGVMEKKAVERYKLWPTLTDRRPFISLIDKDADLSDIPELIDDDIETTKLSIDAYDYFHECISDFVFGSDPDDVEFHLDLLYEALKDGLAVVSIELEGGDDPQTIFETLNSRGIDLSASDLMRNFIFQRATGLGQSGASLNVDKLYKNYWLPLDRQFWQQSASRGRQSQTRINWMLTDHLAMNLGQIVSIDQLFQKYRRWILDQNPMPSSEDELKAIAATAEVERRLFSQSSDDDLGRFGRFADAFDVSTAMPLVVFLAQRVSGAELREALSILEAYILRRDICGLTTKNYNRLFVGIIDQIRKSDFNTVTFLREHLSKKRSDIDRWPSDSEFKQGWVSRDQYRQARQPRLRYIFEEIEREKRNKLSEDIEIKSDLSIEHIMPQAWSENWPLPVLDDEIEMQALSNTRNQSINKIGNLTLLTHRLNASVSNGPLSIKLPAVQAHSSLALNRELGAATAWDEDSILQRSLKLFEIASEVWGAPLHTDHPDDFIENEEAGNLRGLNALADGTICWMEHRDKRYEGKIVGGCLKIDDVDGVFTSLTSASRAITKTSRNGWKDWYIRLPDSDVDILAHDWRAG